MEEFIKHQVNQWMNDSLPRVSIRDPVTIHASDLIGDELEQSRLIDICRFAFSALIEQMKEHHMPAQPVLVIPLVSQDTKMTAATPRDLQELKAQWRHEESPSLYLLHWDLNKYAAIYEEYRSPLVFELFDPPLEGVYEYYREFRDLMYFQNGWEFARCIYAEYYPDYYRL